MNNQENTVLAGLESQVDMLQTEISNLNALLIQCGFSEGITTLKEAAQELLNGCL